MGTIFFFFPYFHFSFFLFVYPSICRVFAGWVGSELGWVGLLAALP